MKEERLDAADVQRENRKLRSALKMLLKEIEKDGPTDCDCVRDCLDNARQNDSIQPPWEREGYGSKQEWLEEK